MNLFDIVSSIIHLVSIESRFHVGNQALRLKQFNFWGFRVWYICVYRILIFAFEIWLYALKYMLWGLSILNDYFLRYYSSLISY